MNKTALHAPTDEVPELELTDEDILDAMQHIPGYLDITMGDFREVYHHAFRHAIDRLMSGLQAQMLMQPVAARQSMQLEMPSAEDCSVVVLADRMRLMQVPLDMSFADALGDEAEDVPDAYERLIMDVIRGNQTLFMRGDEVELEVAVAQWVISDPSEMPVMEKAAGSPMEKPGGPGGGKR